MAMIEVSPEDADSLARDVDDVGAAAPHELERGAVLDGGSGQVLDGGATTATVAGVREDEAPRSWATIFGDEPGRGSSTRRLGARAKSEDEASKEPAAEAVERARARARSSMIRSGSK